MHLWSLIVGVHATSFDRRLILCDAFFFFVFFFLFFLYLRLCSIKFTLCSSEKKKRKKGRHNSDKTETYYTIYFSMIKLATFFQDLPCYRVVRSCCGDCGDETSCQSSLVGVTSCMQIIPPTWLWSAASIAIKAALKRVWLLGATSVRDE